MFQDMVLVVKSENKVKLKRTILKSITYRLICSTETLFISFGVARLMIEPSKQAWAITGILFCLKMVTYCVHEKVWDRFGGVI